MKVLVTGATGFVGREIVQELSENNFRVLALGRSGNPFGAPVPNVEWFRKDITERENWTALETLSEIEAIVHTAGLAHQFGDTKREEFDRVNVVGTENVLDLAVKLRVKHFILIGSTAIYGAQALNFDSKSSRSATSEDAVPLPLTLYAESKLAGEKICRRICEENKIPLTIFRLAPVIGEGNTGNAARLIEAIDKNRFVWIGDGRNLKSLIYKRDVARACFKLLESKKNGTEVFNLAAAPLTMNDFVEQIAGHLDRKIFPARIPELIPRAIFRLNRNLFKVGKIDKVSETVEKWLADDVYTADEIARTYDFKTTTTIEEAIKRQVEHYLQTKKTTKNKI